MYFYQQNNQQEKKKQRRLQKHWLHIDYGPNYDSQIHDGHSTGVVSQFTGQIFRLLIKIGQSRGQTFKKIHK